MSWPFVLVTTSGGAPETGKVAADMTAYYWRQGGSPTSITLSDLAAITSSFSSGGVKEAVNMQGSYRLDIPDAAIAAGVDWVEIAISTSTAYYQFFLAIFAGVDVAAINGVSTSPVTTVKAVQGLTTADTIATVGANGITSSSLATDAINAASVKADAVTKIQTGLATPTNITAGTITTVTNLTNAPTSGDFTATMKASLNASTPSVSVPTANQNADALLARNIDGGSSAGRTVTQALAFLRNKWTLTGTILTVYDIDDTTVLWTATVSTDAAAVPVVGADPT